MNTLLKKSTLLFGFLLVSSIAFAQFADSAEPVLYLYDYTDTDGIKTHNNSEMNWCYAFIFKNGMLTEEHVRTNNLIENGIDRVSENLAKKMSEKIQSLTKTKPFNRVDYERIYKYCDDLSTYSNTTYRRGHLIAKVEIISNPLYLGGGVSTFAKYDGWLWEDPCFTFSKDKSQVIFWYYNNPIKKDYYKRVTLSELRQLSRQKFDFLYE